MTGLCLCQWFNRCRGSLFFYTKPNWHVYVFGTRMEQFCKTFFHFPKTFLIVFFSFFRCVEWILNLLVASAMIGVPLGWDTPVTSRPSQETVGLFRVGLRIWKDWMQTFKRLPSTTGRGATGCLHAELLALLTCTSVVKVGDHFFQNHPEFFTKYVY